LNNALLTHPFAGTLQFRRRGILFVISAPSGAGKSTLLNLLRPEADFVYSVSCTTRPPRPDEVPGRDYHFLSRDEFNARIAAGDFIEFAEVHGNYYGTLRANVLQHLEEGVDVLIDIDTQGAANIRASGGPQIFESLVDVFIMPSSLDLLRRRLIKRGTENEEQIATRLHNAESEMEAWVLYRYLIVTGSPEEDLRNFLAILHAERQRARRLTLAT
jgi:guanylate kinase